MSDTKQGPPLKQPTPQALQAVLSRKNIEIFCTLVFEDESVSYPTVDSVSVRGAQRELTGLLVAHGYTPAGRWSDEGEDEDGYQEWTRSFKPGSDTGRMSMLSDLPMTDSRVTQPELKQRTDSVSTTLPPSS
jgi:hypothetical protein